MYNKYRMLLTLSSDLAQDVQSNGGQFTTTLAQPIQLDTSKEYECALVYLSLYYSMPNISATKGNNTFSYSPDSGTTVKPVVIPDGTWSLPDINAFFKQTMIDNGDFTGTDTVFIELLADFNTLRTQLEITSGTYQITFPAGFASLIGFTPGTYTSSQQGQNLVDITDGSNLWTVSVPDLITANYRGSQRSSVIFTWSPNLPPGSLLTYEPSNLVYTPIVKNYVIQKLTVRIADQLDRVADMRDEVVSVVLHIREKK